MHVGALIFLTDRTISPAEIAVELEQRGYESLWVPEHTHIPDRPADSVSGWR
jgi:alkanesulfonate monooxygenase SsuD/methylene tetrahydromethanopterin reductase-like flavin-dependent oxidoreductase (luciferase family)